MRAGLVAANRRRRDIAARRNVMRARSAIRAFHQYADHPTWGWYYRAYAEALAERVNYPGASLAEIAAELGVTKDAYAARLRRAFEHARQLPVIARTQTRERSSCSR
ncbi:hypothetical protein [Mycobacterium canetti]|uniref:hypothetical protein n=1 Tax=Mycobacterium canetti TaxID=78331 RepID=UPI0003496610|nr:hypothetical protein [Mycobacterium canetti]